jgi:hypothetical protein
MADENDGLMADVTLQSKDHEEILNVIDQLRSEDISRYVNVEEKDCVN